MHEWKRPTPMRKRLSGYNAVLERVVPGGCIPVSGIKVWSLVKLSNQRWSPSAPPVCFCCQMNWWVVVRRAHMGWKESPSWNASGQLVKLCTPQCACLLKRLVFAEVGDLTSWHKTTNCYRAQIVYLDAKGLWKPGQSFILAGFTLSLPCSAPCGTEQTTMDTGCDPALPRNCVDHPADCNLFKTITLLNSQ